MTDDKTRKEFEEWAPGECELYRHAGTGNYASQTTQRLYRAWQAAKERYGQTWVSVYESEPPQGVRALFMERGTEHVICSFPHRRLWEEQGHDLWMPIPATKEQKHEQ